MPLTTSKQLLLDAQVNHYAVGAFNVENMEMAQAVIAAAEALHAPVMLQTTPSTVKYAGLHTYAGLVRALAERASVPVALHLDHGSSVELCLQALDEGYSSVMYDGSQLSLEENIKNTQAVITAARERNIPVEAELGKVGGKEDDLVVDADTNTDPDSAVLFVKQTAVDSLAIAIGTAHGFYAKTPVLDKERLSQIKERVDVPLVLHGASGLSDEDVIDCIQRGICKVNFATELRVAYTDGVKAVLQDKPDTFDPKTYGKAGYERVKQLVMDRIRVCGSDGKAR